MVDLSQGSKELDLPTLDYLSTHKTGKLITEATRLNNVCSGSSKLIYGGEVLNARAYIERKEGEELHRKQGTWEETENGLMEAIIFNSHNKHRKRGVKILRAVYHNGVYRGDERGKIIQPKEKSQIDVPRAYLVKLPGAGKIPRRSLGVYLRSLLPSRKPRQLSGHTETD